MDGPKGSSGVVIVFERLTEELTNKLNRVRLSFASDPQSVQPDPNMAEWAREFVRLVVEAAGGTEDENKTGQKSRRGSLT